jgi:hypothetical protein
VAGISGVTPPSDLEGRHVHIGGWREHYSGVGAITPVDLMTQFD